MRTRLRYFLIGYLAGRFIAYVYAKYIEAVEQQREYERLIKESVDILVGKDVEVQRPPERE